jgi:hypothetical protein
MKWRKEGNRHLKFKLETDHSKSFSYRAARGAHDQIVTGPGADLNIRGLKVAVAAVTQGIFWA